MLLAIIIIVLLLLAILPAIWAVIYYLYYLITDKGQNNKWRDQDVLDGPIDQITKPEKTSVLEAIGSVSRAILLTFIIIFMIVALIPWVAHLLLKLGAG